jgi:preprotein translocase subunit SecG
VLAAFRLILFVIFVVDTVLLVVAVLLQSGRGGGLAGMFGGGGAESALGVRAASTIEKATFVLGGIFLVTALILGFTTESAPTGDDAKIGTRVGGSTTPALTRPGTTPSGAVRPALGTTLPAIETTSLGRTTLPAPGTTPTGGT